MNKKIFIFWIVVIVIICLGIYEYVVAAVESYISLAPIPGLTDGTTLGTNSTQASPGFSAYLRQLYTWVVAAASGLAVVMIMWGGVEYMTSAGGGGVEEAKKRISASIMGLLLALGSYIILATVNKDLLNLNFNLGTISVMQEGFTPFVSKFVDTGAKYIVPTDSMGRPLASGARQVDSEGYLVDGFGERIVNENNEPIQVNNADGFYPHLTSYSPQDSGSTKAMEGGYESATPGLDGQSIVRTLDDYASGRSTYVTLAGDDGSITGNRQIGKQYIIPTITFTNNSGVTQTLTNVPAYVHDTGSAFSDPNSKYWRGGDTGSDFDIAVTRDGNSAVTNQINTRKVEFIPVNN